MDSFGLFAIAWPWFGLGAAVPLGVLLFGTRLLCLDGAGSWAGRLRDTTWLAWLAPFLMLCHIFEEYSCHMTGAEFDFLATLAGNPALGPMVAGVPYAHFPLCNLLWAMVALPVAALLAKRNPVVGLASYGLMAVNGLTHVAATVAQQVPPAQSPGFFTGCLYLFMAFWVCRVALRRRVVNGRGVAALLAAGFLGHVALFCIYPLGALNMPALVVALDFPMVFTSTLAALALSGGRDLKSSMRPE